MKILEGLHQAPFVVFVQSTGFLVLNSFSFEISLRWLVPVFHACAHVKLHTHGLLYSRKVILPRLKRNPRLSEIVSPRKFLVISIYGRKVLPEPNARDLGTSSHLCCKRSRTTRSLKVTKFQIKLSTAGAKCHFSSPLFNLLDAFYSSVIVFVGESDEETENYRKSR